MTSDEGTRTSDWTTALVDIFKQLQADTILLASIGLIFLGIILLGLIPAFQDTNWLVINGLLLLVVGLVALLIRNHSYVLSVCLVTLGSLATVGILVIPLDVKLALLFLFLPVGIFSLMIKPLGGVILSIVLSGILVYLPDAVLQTGMDLRYYAIVAMWLVVGLIYLAIRPLITTVRYVWDSYERNLELLETSRNYQMQLNQTLQELTEANVQQNRFNQMAQSLRQIAEDERKAKEEFVANVSHELRTPLNMITGFCEMILQSPETYGKKIPPTLLSDLGVVLRNSQHLSSLIDDVLDLSQIDAGRMALVKERVDFTEIIKTAVTAVRPLYESKGLYLKTEIEEPLPPVYCDRTRMREVLLNLLSNAGRFTEEGGVIVKVIQDRNFLQVSVQDTGPGISDTDKEKLFRPFQQLDSSINRRKGGTGLGLSISKSFVELHDGKMWVESEKEHGTTFTFRLPVQPLVTNQSSVTRWINPYLKVDERPRTPRRETPVPLPRIAIVEDGSVIQRFLGRYLEGVEMVHYDNLDNAVEQIRQEPVQAVVINDMNPSGVLEYLGNNGKLPETIPAIIASIPGIDQASGIPGVVDYLVKPISKTMLTERISALKNPVTSILIVDDEEDAQKLFRRMLVSVNKDYRVFRAVNGKQALAILKHEQVDVILLDLVMPDMNGFEFLTEKNSNPEWKDIPVILISARDPQGHPIVTQSLAVARGGGISAQQFLMSLQSLMNILSPFHSPTN